MPASQPLVMHRASVDFHAWDPEAALIEDAPPLHLDLDFDGDEGDDESHSERAGAFVATRFSAANGDTEVVVIDRRGDHCISPSASNASALHLPPVASPTATAAAAAVMPTAAKSLMPTHVVLSQRDRLSDSTDTLASASVSPRHQLGAVSTPPSSFGMSLPRHPFSSADLVSQDVGERLGIGASGSVHALRSIDASAADVAVKIIDESRPETAAAATREIAFAVRLQQVHAAHHGHSQRPSERRIVSVHRVYRSAAQQQMTVTMELLSGATALDIAALRPPMLPAAVRARLPPGVVPCDAADGSAADAGGLRARVREGALGAVARDALEGLVFLHGAARVAHRDLRPENLLLDRDGRVKIGDFGMVAVAPLDGAPGAAAGMDAFAGDQVGTIGYLSPERLRGEAHGAPGDVWALGMTLLQLALGGVHPLRFDPAHPDGGGDLGFFQVASRLGALDRDGAGGAAPPPAVQHALDGCALSPEATDFLARLLRPAPAARPTAPQALVHPWLARHKLPPCARTALP